MISGNFVGQIDSSWIWARSGSCKSVIDVCWSFEIGLAKDVSLELVPDDTVGDVLGYLR